MTHIPAKIGLCLLAEIRPGADWHDRIGDALDATGAVTLVLFPPRDAVIDVAAARPIVELAQRRKVAALLVDDTVAARAAGADGVHLTWRPEIEDAYAAARKALGTDFIVGADAGFSRHDAMTIGEAGADYVAFGLPPGQAPSPEIADERADLIAWWVDLFVVPAIAFDVASNDEAATLVRAGADFVAMRLPETLSGATLRDWAADLAAALRIPADAA